MAKKIKKDLEYLVSGLDITYYIPVGLIALLSSASNMTQREVWCAISDIGNICANRLLTKLDNGHRYPSSWTTQKIPNSNCAIRIDMSASIRKSEWDPVNRTYINIVPPKRQFHCKIKISGNATETFKQSQIDEFIISTMEESLLGLLEDSESENINAEERDNENN